MKNSSVNIADSVDVRKLRRDGYVVIRDVFSPDEIVRLRSAALASGDHEGDILSNPTLRDILLDSRVLAIARQILQDTPVYFGDSSCVIGDRSFGYHKDNADRNDPNAPDWQSPYTLIRFGLYLQDHHRHSGGLNVRRGSHNFTDATTGKTVYVRTRPGDLVVWNLRVSHSGNGKLLRVLHNLFIEPQKTRELPSLLFLPEEATRAALFFTFGRDDDHLKRLLEQLKTRAYMIDKWRASSYSDDVWAASQAKELVILDMQKKIDGVPGLGESVGYTPIPY